MKRKKEKRVVLVGTYKGDQLEKWRGWYNYPLGNGKLGTGNGRAVAPRPPKPHGTYYALFKTELKYRHKSGKCVFSSKWDKETAKTYYNDFCARRVA